MSKEEAIRKLAEVRAKNEILSNSPLVREMIDGLLEVVEALVKHEEYDIHEAIDFPGATYRG
jgi:hypothetical protein